MRRIAIIGTAPSSEMAPFGDETWEIWGMSHRGPHVTRATRWFELHSLRSEEEDWVRDWKEKLEEWTQDCELWDLKRFPVERIKERFGTYFLTSTVAWCMALAIDEGADEIGLWGCDMEYGTEYREQRAGVKHFIELGRFAGIVMTVPGFNGIAYSPVPYPMWQDDPLVLKTRHREKLQAGDLRKLTEKRDGAEKRIFQLETMLHFIRAPMDAETINTELESLYEQLPKLQMDVAGCTGQLRATQWQRNFLKP